MSSYHSSLPHLEKIERGQQLIVDGKPFLMLGGELQNSSMTSAAYMDTVWQKLADTNVNTVLGCVTWEDIEPKEGEFDFSELDKIIKGARAHGLRLVLLWFGSFKNGKGQQASKCIFSNITQVSQHMSLPGRRRISSVSLERTFAKPGAFCKQLT
jgi:GH35 family endo-1,4-beta-xylanase